jgi:hypothetical protein
MLHFGVLLSYFVGASTIRKWFWSRYVSCPTAETTKRPLGTIYSVDE